MAFVDNLERAEPQRTNQHGRLHRCEYTSFVSDRGQMLFQINTYGTAGRQHPDKVSQSLQFDEASARILIAALREAFPNIDD